MAAYLLRRGIYTLLSLWVIVSAVFFMLRLAPGGPFDSERALPPEVEANLMAAYNLDAPLYVQYGRFLGDLTRGDFGPSFTQKDFSVAELIGAGLPTSLALGIGALSLALSVGLALGTFCGRRTGSFADGILMSITNVSLALPPIITGPILILVFAVTLSWLPSGGSGSAGHLLLPVIALALPYIAAIARLIRGAVAEAAREQFIVTAYAKGIGRQRILWHHIMPTAAIPLVSFLGPAAAGLLTGSVVVEQIFDLPGIGRYFVQAALNRDYTLVMGVAVIYAMAILFFNLLVDLAYGVLDPRIRFDR
ncbi:MAG: ABC transporter permease [Pseudomonadota bacterium]